MPWLDPVTSARRPLRSKSGNAILLSLNGLATRNTPPQADTDVRVRALAIFAGGSVDGAGLQRVDERAVPTAFAHGRHRLLLLNSVGDGLLDQSLGLLGSEGEQAVLVADDDVARADRQA